MDIDTLKSLRERVLAASGRDRTLDIDIARGTDHYWLAGAVVEPSGEAGCPEDIIWRKSENEPAPNSTGWYHDSVEFYTASIDAALDLVERMLPGWSMKLIIDELGPAFLMRNSKRLSNDGAAWIERAATPPLAILAALLSALIAKQADT